MDELDYTPGMLKVADTPNEPPMVRYIVVDSHTGKTMGSYATGSRARLAADKLDNAYGGYRFKVLAPWMQK